jgi:hypothetical protein
MNNLRGAFGVGVITGWVLSLILPVRSAVSEVYIAGQVGANIPQDLSDTQSSLGGPPSAEITSRCKLPWCTVQSWAISLTR